MTVILALGTLVLLAAFLAGIAVGMVARYEMDGRPDRFPKSVAG
jgi:hypothetical protein